MSSELRLAIIGGGMIGLNLARLLQGYPVKITIFEAAPNLGGLAAPWQLKDITWDQFYHVILLSDTATRECLETLGLQEDFVTRETKTGFYTDNRLYSMSNSLEFLKFPPLRIWQKLRLAWTIFYASKIKNWHQLEQIPVQDWLIKHSGRATFEKIWKPLLRAKLGDAYLRTSAAFIWATIARMYAARRSGMKKEMFGYVHGGYQRIIEKLADWLIERNTTIHTNTPIEKVSMHEDQVLVQTLHDVQSFDYCICTTPPARASAIIPQLSTAEHETLTSLEYQGIVCASVLLKKKISPYYVTNITEDWLPFTAVIEMTSLVPPEELKHHHLVYLPKYAASNDPLFSETNESIQERFTDALLRMAPHLSRHDIEAFQIAKCRQVFPVSVLNYSQKVPPMQTSLERIFLVNSAQIVNGTLNVNETIQLARRGAAAVSTYLESTKKLALST